MAGGRIRGGICGLLDLIEEHRAALRYDWRSRFGRGLDESVPDDIGWDEAIDLVRVLRTDPSSMLAASVEKWDYPFSRTEVILADIWDLSHAKAGPKKPERYPRPFKTPDASTKRHGNAAGRSREQVVAILRAHGHELS